MKLSFEGTQEEILATLKAICRSDSVVNNYTVTSPKYIPLGGQGVNSNSDNGNGENIMSK